MVSTPVESTFTTGPPEIVPNIAEDTIAAWAGPPRKLRVQLNAILMSERPPDEMPKSEPRTI